MSRGRIMWSAKATGRRDIRKELAHEKWLEKLNAKRQLRDARRRVTNGTHPNRVAALIERDGDLCYLCGKKPERYHIDHVAPRSHGGTNHDWNLALTCGPCNLRKGTFIVAMGITSGLPRYTQPQPVAPISRTTAVR